MAAAADRLHFGPPRIGLGSEGIDIFFFLGFFVGTTGEKQAAKQADHKPFFDVVSHKSDVHTRFGLCSRGKDCIIPENVFELPFSDRFNVEMICLVMLR